MPAKPKHTAEERALELVRGFIDLLISSCREDLRKALLKIRP